MSENRNMAYRRLRAVFADVYNELRRRGHSVTVDYEDPANPFYIPRMLEVDDQPIDLRFAVAYEIDKRGEHYLEVSYSPTPAARSRGARRDVRIEWSKPMRVDRVADWLERLLEAEKLAASWYARVV